MTGRAALSHRLEYAAFRLVRGLWAALPERAALTLGGALGWVAGCVLRIRRRAVDEHLALVFPDESPSWRRRVAVGSYVHLGREAAVLARMHRWSDRDFERRLRWVGFDTVQEAVAEGNGAVVLTAHLGNWEMAGAAVAARGVPLDVVGKGMANRRFEADLFATRERLGMRVIEISEARRGVLRSLAAGRVVAILGDQNAHRHGIFLPFFGRLAATHRGTALFPLRTGVPVFVGFATRDTGGGTRPHRYVLEMRPLRMERSGDLEEDIESLLTAYHGVLEEAIRAAPEQYFWQHLRWKTRPPEEQPPPG